jgi:hypothetical protein
VERRGRLRGITMCIEVWEGRDLFLSSISMWRGVDSETYNNVYEVWGERVLIYSRVSMF